MNEYKRINIHTCCTHIYVREKVSEREREIEVVAIKHP